MGDFRIDIPQHRRSAARHIADVRRKLLRAFAQQNISFRSIATALGITTSRLERELTGQLDITLGRVGELANLLGRRVEISFPAESSAGVSRMTRHGNLPPAEPSISPPTQPVPAAKSESHNHSEGGRDVG